MEGFHGLFCMYAGAYFHLSDSIDVNIEYLCKLSADHRQIIISHDHMSINMRNILEVKTLHGEGVYMCEGGGRLCEKVCVCVRVGGRLCEKVCICV